MTDDREIEFDRQDVDDALGLLVGDTSDAPTGRANDGTSQNADDQDASEGPGHLRRASGADEEAGSTQPAERPSQSADVSDEPARAADITPGGEVPGPPGANDPLEHVETLAHSGEIPSSETADDGGRPATEGSSVRGPRVQRRLARKEKKRHRGAGDFTSERMLRPQAQAPKRGWRRGLFRLTGGRINIADANEYRERELIARIKAPVDGTQRIAVISRKGGVGKTTTTLMLGHVFASHRGDRVIALDGNPDAGSLAYRVNRETSNTIMDLLHAPHDLSRYADMRAFTNQASSRLEVLAASDDPKITDALGEQDYIRVAKLLDFHYNLACMDTGTGVLESATRGILELADQVVVVMGPSLDSARTAASTLDWLEENGYSDLVDDAVAVINALGRSESEASRLEEHFLNRSGLVEIDRIEEHFRARCRSVVRVPWDARLDAGAEAEPSDLSPATQDAYLELAAAVADGF